MSYNTIELNIEAGVATSELDGSPSERRLLAKLWKAVADLPRLETSLEAEAVLGTNHASWPEYVWLRGMTTHGGAMACFFLCACHAH